MIQAMVRSRKACFLWLIATIGVWGANEESCRAASIEVQKVGDITVASIEGEIISGDDLKFKRLALQHEIDVVALNSPGGNLEAGLSIGRAIQLQGYSTVVLDGFTCASACSLIWLAGSPRFVSRGAKIGFHASYFDDLGKRIPTATGNALVGHYLSQLNLPTEAVVFATSASPYEVSWLDVSQTSSNGISFSPLESSATGKAVDEGVNMAVPSVQGMGLSSANPPDEFIIQMSMKIGHGFDVTPSDMMAWISINAPGRADDYALSAIDIFKEQGKQVRQIWMRGYHKRNADVPYRESKTLLAFDCKAMMIQERRFYTYSADGLALDQIDNALDPYSPVPGTVAYGWLVAGCTDL